MQAVKELRKEAEEKFKYSREKVFELIQEGLDLAKAKGDPGAFFRGVSEINRMCGFYEPEKHEVTHTHQGEVLVRRLETMSEQELLEKLGGEQGLVIEGEIVKEGEDVGSKE
jgi:hypothetical protein